MAAKYYRVAPGYSIVVNGKIYGPGEVISETQFRDKKTLAKLVGQKKLIELQPGEKRSLEDEPSVMSVEEPAKIAEEKTAEKKAEPKGKAKTATEEKEV